MCRKKEKPGGNSFIPWLFPLRCVYIRVFSLTTTLVSKHANKRLVTISGGGQQVCLFKQVGLHSLFFGSDKKSLLSFIGKKRNLIYIESLNQDKWALRSLPSSENLLREDFSAWWKIRPSLVVVGDHKNNLWRKRASGVSRPRKASLLRRGGESLNLRFFVPILLAMKGWTERSLRNCFSKATSTTERDSCLSDRLLKQHELNKETSSSSLQLEKNILLWNPPSPAY